MPFDFDLRFIEDETGRALKRASGQLVRLLRILEDERLEAYRDSAGVLTIGVGHTGDVRPGQVISEAESEDLLRRDLSRFEAGVRRLVDADALSQNQFDALVSFTFNVGLGAFERSTMRALINRGELAQAAAEFPKWRLAGGEILDGLVKRRAVEQAIFERSAYDFTPYDGDLSDAQEYRVTPDRPTTEPRTRLDDSRTMRQTRNSALAGLAALLATLQQFLTQVFGAREQAQQTFAGLPEPWMSYFGLAIALGAAGYVIWGQARIRIFRFQDWVAGFR